VNDLPAVLWMTTGWHDWVHCARVPASHLHMNSYVLCHTSSCTQVM